MINIKKIDKSNIKSFKDLENIPFGSLFTDHCFISTYKDGSWVNPSIIPLKDVKFPPTIQALHYGQEIFEGMKAYRDAQGNINLFRPNENIKRMNKSAKRIQMPDFPNQLFIDGLTKLIQIDKNWVDNYPKSLYIRPLMFASSSTVIARPSKEYTFIIICCPVSVYFSDKLNVKMETKFIRAAKGGTGSAKAGGNYGASFYPNHLAKKEGFDEIIWIDSIKKEYIEEASTMNIFIRIKDTLLTPNSSDTILPGITRNSIIELAKKLNIKTEQRPIKLKEIIEEHKKGNLKELWGCGTATIITFIKSFSYENTKYELPSLDEKDDYGLILRKTLLDIQYNRTQDHFNWNLQVC